MSALERLPDSGSCSIVVITSYSIHYTKLYELEVAERWYADSVLEDLLGVSLSQVNEARLYRGLDA